MEDPSVVWGVQSTDSLSASNASAEEAMTQASDAYGSCSSSSTLHFPRWVMPFPKESQPAR